MLRKIDQWLEDRFISREELLTDVEVAVAIAIIGVALVFVLAYTGFKNLIKSVCRHVKNRIINRHKG